MKFPKEVYGMINRDFLDLRQDIPNLEYRDGEKLAVYKLVEVKLITVAVTLEKGNLDD